jgi:hypothetical protein
VIICSLSRHFLLTLLHPPPLLLGQGLSLILLAEHLVRPARDKVRHRRLFSLGHPDFEKKQLIVLRPVYVAVAVLRS